MQRAIRRLFAIYLAVAGAALLFPYRPKGWLIFAALHAIGIALMLKPRLLLALQPRFPRTARIICDWYMLLVVPALYKELAVLNRSVFNGRYFDAVIMNIEQHLFGHQPSRELAHALPYLPLSEFLHLSYVSYYFIIYVPAFVLYLSGRRAAHQQLVFNLMLAFFGHYVFFIYFPVQGPRYLFPAPGGNISRGWFYQFAHKVLEKGSSQGSAFPSSHVGVSFAQSSFAVRALPRLAPFLLFFSTALALGAVYGGFHYATDTLVGFAYGLLLFWLAPRFARVLGGADR